jgi:hypothetical protein
MELVSFRSKKTKVILTPQNEWVKKQLEANDEFEVVGKTAGEKTIKDYTKKELVAYLKEKGIEEANEDMKKDELLALVPTE